MTPDLTNRGGVDIYNYEGEWVKQHAYYRDDDTFSTITVQLVRDNVPASTLGNQNRDQFYVQFSGLDTVTWGNKDYAECFEGAQVGVGPVDLSENDQTPCLAWQKTMGW